MYLFLWRLIQTHKTRSYMHIIPMLHTLYYVVIQVIHTCVTCSWKICYSRKFINVDQQTIEYALLIVFSVLLFCYFCIKSSSQAPWFLPAFTRQCMSVWWNWWSYRRLSLRWPWALWGASRWKWPHQVLCIAAHIFRKLKQLHIKQYSMVL